MWLMGTVAVLHSARGLGRPAERPHAQADQPSYRALPDVRRAEKAGAGPAAGRRHAGRAAGAGSQAGQQQHPRGGCPPGQRGAAYWAVRAPRVPQTAGPAEVTSVAAPVRAGRRRGRRGGGNSGHRADRRGTGRPGPGPPRWRGGPWPRSGNERGGRGRDAGRARWPIATHRVRERHRARVPDPAGGRCPDGRRGWRGKREQRGQCAVGRRIGHQPQLAGSQWVGLAVQPAAGRCGERRRGGPASALSRCA